MLWKGFQRPKRLESDRSTLTPTYGKFVAQPFERGFATTLGNALRRCLLSSIEGAAITAINIDGVLHEFSAMPGVVEDVTDVILNLKQVPIVLHSEEAKILSLDVEGPAEVTAGDFAEDGQIEIFDKDLHIATVNEEGRLRLQALVKNGRGYVSADHNFDETMGIGWVPIDSAHSPVRRVNYKVEAARLGQTTDYERLILDVYTNGTIPPELAVSRAAMLLRDHLGIFISAEESIREEVEEPDSGLDASLEALLAKEIDQLELSVRSVNSLKNANIHTLRDLVVKSEKEMLETKNFGKKSLEEVLEVLEGLGLSLGTELPDKPASSAA